MKKLLITLFSLLTFTGGHVVNRRWDQTLLFFALLLVWVTGGWMATSWLGMPDAIDDPAAMMDHMVFNTRVILAGIVAMLLASALTTWLEQPATGRGSVSGMTGGIAVTLLSLGVIGTQVFSAIAINDFSHMREGDEEGVLLSSTSLSADDFNEHVYYGRPSRGNDWTRKDRIAGGDGVLVVGTTYQGQPAAGVELKVTFGNGKQTDWASTDDSGKAVFLLPPGDYLVTSLRTRRWSNKPQDQKVYLDNGLSPKVARSFYWPHEGYMDRDGLEVHITTEMPAEPQLGAIIRDEIKLEWPPQGGKEAEATLATSIIRWQAVPGAKQYRVQLSEVTETDRGSTSYHPVVWHDATGTSMPLSALPTVSSPDGDAHYTTRIYAFDASGQLVGSSEGLFDGGKFMLKDKRRFPNMQSLSFVDGKNIDEEQLEKIVLDRKRLRAADTLIDDGFYDAARRLLDLVDSPELASRKGCSIGHLLAKQGDCDAARSAFAELTFNNPDYVIPERYLKTCETQ